MATRQDELRRLMKESKDKTQTKNIKPHPAATKKRDPAHAGFATGDRKPQGRSHLTPSVENTPSSTKATAIPAGFFDDSLADAKARNVDIKQVAEKQLEQDWEQFQEFVAEVEEEEVKEAEIQQEEAKEKEAVEQLENMQYVDRYRIALERAAKVGSRDSKKRDASAATATSSSGSIVVDVEGEETAAQVVANAFHKHVKKKQKVKKAESSEDDGFDPCNWRSKAL